MVSLGCFVGIYYKTTTAQEKFTVPELTVEQKQWRVTSQMNAIVLNNINYAKKMGQSVEEAAQFTGDQFKLSWNIENGWEGFARGCLNNWSIFRPDNVIEILEQSETMVKFKSKIPNAWLKNNGPLYNVSHEEYMLFIKIIHNVIADYLGAAISFKDVEGGIVITIKQK